MLNPLLVGGGEGENYLASGIPAVRLLIVGRTRRSIMHNEFTAIIEKDGRFGYVNNKGKEIIKPQYEKADFFSEGLAAVRVKGKYGYINKCLG
ncbi:MAG: WG repeat-containing protein [Atribacterota bacterium]